MECLTVRLPAASPPRSNAAPLCMRAEQLLSVIVDPEAQSAELNFGVFRAGNGQDRPRIVPWHGRDMRQKQRLRGAPVFRLDDQLATFEDQAGGGIRVRVVQLEEVFRGGHRNLDL